MKKTVPILIMLTVIPAWAKTPPALTAQETVAPTPVFPPAPAAEKPAVEPLAGYANGAFFLRDPHDWFVLFPKGRLQVDWYNFPSRGNPPAGAVYIHARSLPSARSGELTWRLANAAIAVVHSVMRRRHVRTADDRCRDPCRPNRGVVSGNLAPSSRR